MGKNARLKRERKALRTAESSATQLPTTAAADTPHTADAYTTSALLRILSSPWLHVSLIISLCIITAIFPIESEDIFSNIATGQLLWNTHSIPTNDPFSYTGPYPWLLNRPLPSLVFYGIHSLGGLPAIQLFCAAIYGCAYAITYYVWSRRTGMPQLTFAVSIVAILASCYWFQTRIYVFAYLFTAITFLLITSDRRKVMLWSIPIQILWINSHPSAILGIVLVGFWWLVEIYRAKQFDRFATTVFLGVLLANAFSPAGFQSYIKFADEIFGDHPSRANIYEWFSPFHPLISSQHLARWFYGSLFLVPIVLAVQFVHGGVRLCARPLVPIAIALCALSIGSARHIPLFYFSFFGVLVCTAEHLWKHTAVFSRTTLERYRVPIAASLICIALGVVLKVAIFGYSNGDVERSLALGIDKRKFPERPTEILLRANVGGNIFSDYGSSSYFIYRMYPRYKVYIDSARLDEVYGEEGFRHYIRFGNDVQIITGDIAKYDIRSFILPLPAAKDDIVQIYTFLSSDPAWRLAFFDDHYMVFISESEAAARGVPTYEILSPFMETEKILKENPGAAAALARDFELGERTNPDSIAFLTLKAYFLKFQGRSAELQATLDRLPNVCTRLDPSRGCRRIAARQLIRMGRFKQASELAPEEM